MLKIFFESLLVSGGLFYILTNLISKKLVRWGGGVMITSFIFLVLLHSELELSQQLLGLLLGSIAILFFGFLDDWKNFSWKTQLLFQLCLGLLLIASGFKVDYFHIFNQQVVRLDQVVWKGITIFSSIFIFGWLLVLINSINWLDGSDSIMSGVALIAGLSLFYVSFLPEVNQPAIAILATIFLGIISGFLLFNFPPAKVEAGTSGSYFIGFLLASLAIIAGSKIITAMIVLILPLADLIWVILHRWQTGKSIFQKDKNHLHHRLKMIGWSDKKIFFIYVLFLGFVLVVYSFLESRFWRL